jgi:hypothetical protein
MLMCKEATRLISEGLDRRLPLRQRTSLRLHVTICGACSAYKRQLEALHLLFRKRFGAAGPTSRAQPTDALALPAERADAIRRLLREALDNESP